MEVGLAQPAVVRTLAIGLRLSGRAGSPWLGLGTRLAYPLLCDFPSPTIYHTLHITLSALQSTTTLPRGYSYFSHFTDGKTEALGGKVTCPSRL